MVMVNKIELAKLDAAAAAERAIRELAPVRKWGETAFVNLPMFFPGGTAVTIRVAESSMGFIVSDNGFTYSELQAVGAERSFAKASKPIVEAHGITRNGHLLYVDVQAEDLPRAIADVAAASWQITTKVYADRAEDPDEVDLEEELTGKLISLFGKSNVIRKKKLYGVSAAVEWEVSALVKTKENSAIFQAVGSRAQSVYRVNSAFHDISGIENPPSLVAVVRDKSALGKRLGLLSQAGMVIEEGQPEEVFRRSIK